MAFSLVLKANDRLSALRRLIDDLLDTSRIASGAGYVVGPEGG